MMRVYGVRRLSLGVLVLAGAVFLTACGANASPAIVTMAPTSTPVETATSIPVELETSTPTGGFMVATSTPLSTSRPTTPTAGPSPTSLLGPTAPPTRVVVQPTRQPTQSLVKVEYFTTDSSSAIPGKTVTLFWGVRGADRVQIFRVDDQGESLYRWDVNPEGKLTVQVPGADRDAAAFLLSAEASGTVVEQQLLIPLECPFTWFFDPSPESCPTAEPQVSNQVEQTFEFGRMFWVEALDRVYVVFDDGSEPRWAFYPDDYQDSDPARDDNLVPPPGLEQPVRGFGLVWRGNFRVQERLGWATSPEVGYEGLYQSNSEEPSVATMYLRMKDGGIVGLNAERDEWEFIPPASEP